eukprot:6537171-Alexandrium_andersonii.AAC.1
MKREHVVSLLQHLCRLADGLESRYGLIDYPELHDVRGIAGLRCPVCLILVPRWVCDRDPLPPHLV